MQYTYYDLGQCSPTDVIEVTLSGNAANVKLLDRTNFNAYKNGRIHKYYGGYVEQSPCKLKVPHYGEWFVTIDLGGYSGGTASSVRKI